MMCVVTDGSRRDVIAQVTEAVAAGVDLVQIREPGLEAADLSTLVSAVMRIARGTATRIVVNDRLDVALACGADGVHLRADSIPASAARTLAPAPFLIGRSVHSRDEAAGVSDVDYLIAGTVFPTPSKPEGGARLGFEGLRAIASATRVPVLAIGGVTLDRLDDVRSAGASGVAAIGLFSGPAPIRAVADEIRRRFDRFDKFDRGKPPS